MINRPTGAAATINSAQASAGGRGKPAGPSGPGPSKQADMGAAFSSNVVQGVRAQLSSLAECTASMSKDHPIAHYDHGPHHGTDHHRRHVAVDMSQVGVKRQR